MKEIKCKVGQRGYCVGKIFRLEDAPEISYEPCADIEEEKRKLKDAVGTLAAELKEKAAKAGPENAKILEADCMILEDAEFSGAIWKVLDEKKAKLSYAVQEGGKALALVFENSASDYIRERAADVRGLTKRLVDLLENRKGEVLSEPSVVVAKELTPEGFASLDSTKLLGLITEKGTASSHVSIMAGNLGISYVIQAEFFAELADGLYVIVDTEAETILLDPEESVREEAERKAKALLEACIKVAEEAKKARLKTKICANISNAEHPEVLRDCGADGVGLFRSEFLFLERKDAPSEEAQYEAYTAVLKAMGEKEVVIRTMDIGSDKKASWLVMPEEKNPALGTRGYRISYRNPELFRTQLRALLRAAINGNLKVMFPMIVSEWEVDEIRKTVEQVAEELKKEGVPCRIPPLGIMVETPAAALIADRLAEKVAFFSIGTNDLTQYTIALDREAEGLEAFYQPHHEAVLRLIRTVCDAAHAAGIEAAVCGELAADPEMIPELIKAGVDELSVSAAKVSLVRAVVAEAEKERFLAVASPCDGRMIAMEEIGDPVFASGMMGKAIGVIPSENTVYAPVSGKLVSLAETKHAFTIETEDGRQVLVHVGIDTVKLAGKGFEALVKQGEAVNSGQPLLKVDFEMIRKEGLDPTVIVIALNQ